MFSLDKKILSSDFASIDRYSLYALLSGSRCYLELNDIPELREIIEKIELLEFGHIFE